jgi:hypothetical protein
LANTLAYYDTATITAVKSFIVQAPAYFSGTDSVKNYIFGPIFNNTFRINAIRTNVAAPVKAIQNISKPN